MFDSASSSLLKMNFIKVFYQYAYLRGRKTSGVTLPSNESQRLGSLQSLLEHRDAEQRRSHRRQASMLPVLLKAGRRLVRGTALNVSGGGMLLACPAELEPGAQVRATFGNPGETQYIFTCKVTRRDEVGYGLSFTGIPLEIRYGSYLRTAERAAS